jgi:hypothetical protein
LRWFMVLGLGGCTPAVPPRPTTESQVREPTPTVSSPEVVPSVAEVALPEPTQDKRPVSAAPRTSRSARPASACTPTSYSDLEGVRLELLDPPCTVTRAQAAAGLTFSWVLVVDSSPGEVVLDPFWARCQSPGASALVVQPVLSGTEGRYCECDVGNCIPAERRGVPQAGRYPGSLVWDGSTWEGPSDFSNPKGPPFSPGPLVFRVESRGTHGGRPFRVSAEVPVTLAP